jgi:hypothetical protein
LSTNQLVTFLWWFCRGCSPLPIPNREVKPPMADGTAFTCGRVGSRHISYSNSLSKPGKAICIYRPRPYTALAYNPTIQNWMLVKQRKGLSSKKPNRSCYHPLFAVVNDIRVVDNCWNRSSDTASNSHCIHFLEKTCAILNLKTVG